MIDEQLEQELIACLDRIEAGATVEQALADFPASAAALRPMLEVAAALRDEPPAPDRSAQQASRRAFLNQAAELRESRRPGGWLLSRLAGAALALGMLVLVGGGTVVASEGALPGDSLYGVKRAVEQVRLSLASDPESVGRQLADERRLEVERLAAEGRVASVSFEGPIQSVGGDAWQVAGIDVLIDAGTVVEGEGAVGRVAHVDASITAGSVTARRITVRGGGAPPPPTSAPTQPPTQAPTQAPTRTPAPSPTSAPTRTAAPTAAPTQLPTAAPTQPPTSAPTRAPRATATPSPQPSAVPSRETAEPDDHSGLTPEPTDDHSGLTPEPGDDGSGGSGGGSDGGSGGSGGGGSDGGSGGSGGGSDGGSGGSGGGSDGGSGGSGGGGSDDSGGGSGGGGSDDSGGGGGSSPDSGGGKDSGGSPDSGGSKDDGGGHGGGDQSGG